MKFKNYTIIQFCLIVNLFLIACNDTTAPFPEKEFDINIEYPENALLIEEYESAPNEISPSWLVKTYEYDKYKRLVKTSIPMRSDDGKIIGISAYTTYEYNKKGLLIKEKEYSCASQSDPELTLLTVYDYIYSLGKLQTKHRTNYYRSIHSYTQYTYEKDLLAKEEQYFDNKLTYYMTYEYNPDGKLITVKTYNPVNNGAYFAWCSYSEYEYENSLVSLKKRYNVDNETTLSATSTEIYYYDSNANLIMIKTHVHKTKDNHFPMPILLPNDRWFVYK